MTQYCPASHRQIKMGNKRDNGQETLARMCIFTHVGPRLRTCEESIWKRNIMGVFPYGFFNTHSLQFEAITRVWNIAVKIPGLGFTPKGLLVQLPPNRKQAERPEQLQHGYNRTNLENLNSLFFLQSYLCMTPQIPP